MKRLALLEESEEEEEGGGTAKQKESPSKSTFSPPVDWRSSLSQNRLSTMFDSWMNHTAVIEQPATPEKKVVTVSEPKLVEQRADNNFDAASPSAEDSEFEEMLVS